ncbi:MAG: aspartate/glutamate racemase family protein, partial [Myxococcales bacterium]|nr:aspartate/glutamate racemase family protein [Myxococcales bacterium]
TAHAFFQQLRARSPVPLLDMVAATLERVFVGAGARAGVGPRRVGLLATTGALRARVFHSRAVRWPALELISPLDLMDGDALQEALVMTPIYGPLHEGRRGGGGLKSGVRGEVVAAPLREAARRLIDAGATALICGCTEIPLVLKGEAFAGAALVDPLAVAAELALAIACGEAPLPA